ncbi:MAG TPA: universal stress protein [Rhizomicrobium sp.]|nr:universal stress protein [Rhizomicrobium sp.]
MYKRILLSYDGSIESLRALREGTLLARACHADVFLLSVVPVTAGTLIVESGSSGLMAAQNQEYIALLKRATDKLKELGIEHKARLVEGEPTPAIAAVAKEISADLVIVGHRSKGLLSRWWSGSKHDYLSDYLNCSLLIARNPLSDEEFDRALKAFVSA